MLFKVTKRFEFDAAHRLVGHRGKCRSFHGHRYVAEITLGSEGLNHEWMILDFSDVKNLVGAWIDDNWDHNSILNKFDPLVQPLEEMAIAEDVAMPYLFDGNPTAEQMAEELYKESLNLLEGTKFSNVVITKVKLNETPGSWAEYEPKL